MPIPSSGLSTTGKGPHPANGGYSKRTHSRRHKRRLAQRENYKQAHRNRWSSCPCLTDDGAKSQPGSVCWVQRAGGQVAYRRAPLFLYCFGLGVSSKSSKSRAAKLGKSKEMKRKTAKRKDADQTENRPGATAR